MKVPYKAYKEEAGFYDFTDMLEKFRERGRVPKFDLFIVDEAQDLSAIQWAIIDKLRGDCTRVYYAGDDN